MKNVLLFENSSKDIINSRLDLLRFLKSNNYQIFLIGDPSSKLKKLCLEENFHFFELAKLKSKNIFRIVKNIFLIRKYLKVYNIETIHCFRFHPILLGNFGSLFLNVKRINHITGLGSYFTYKTNSNKLISFFIKSIYTFCHKILKAETVVQNPDDKKDLNLDCHVIKGSTVNEKIFNSMSKSQKEKSEFKDYDLVYFYASRLLKSKGVIQLSNAFQEYSKHSNLKVILLIAGEPDFNNPDSISFEEYEKLSLSNKIQKLGSRSDISYLIGISDCCVFPSIYREGIPRFMLESLSMGKPIITTNTPGNKEVFNNNGVLLENNKSKHIYKSLLEIEKMDKEALGKKSLHLYEKEFSQKVIFNQILNLYKKLN